MFSQMLYAQWKWNRDFLAFFTVAFFAIPLGVLMFALPEYGTWSTREYITWGQVVGGFSTIFAVIAGIAIAAQGYGVDERGGHIYALSLPITRRRFLGYRALGGFALLALPALGLWLGGTLAATQIELPPTLRAYAGALAVRALLGAWFVHSCIFSLRYAAGPRLRAVMGVLVVVAIAIPFIAVTTPQAHALLTRVGDFLISYPGPFGVLFGRWTLIDV